MSSETSAPSNLRDFVYKAIALDDNEFEIAMRLDNNDHSIEELEIIAQPLETYDRY